MKLNHQVRKFNSSTRVTINRVVYVDDKNIKLTLHNDDATAVRKDECVKLKCEGSAAPHRKIIWYRHLNSSNSSAALSITEYWSGRYYYETTTSLLEKDGISSSLKIHKFNEGYVGLYYCVITNGVTNIESPTTNLTLCKF